VWQAALRISRVVSDVVRAYGVAGGALWLDLSEISYPSISTEQSQQKPRGADSL
jgi:hypothetical protein